MALETNRLVTHQRRLREGWYSEFAPQNAPGLDIGCADDHIHSGSKFWTRYDRSIDPDMDAQTLPPSLALPQERLFQTVYASHILEHMENPWYAIACWAARVIKGGHLIICVPHRDLYEKQATLPSRWNADHKSLWVPEGTCLPYTLGLVDVVDIGILLLHQATGRRFDTVHCQVLQAGYIAGEPDEHPNGEYSIEMIVRRVY